MEWVETTGKTIEEAKDAALDRLGVADDDAEFEILEEPRAGLFGLLRGEARVRARVRPTEVRPKQDRRRGGRRDRPKDAERSEEAGGDGATATLERPADDTEPAPTAEDAAPAVSAERRGGGAEARGEGRNGRGRGRGDDGRGREARRRDDDEGDERDADGPSVEPAEVGAAAETFVAGLVSAFGLQGTTSLTVDDTDLDVRVDGSDLGLLIGPGGRTLLAVQDLARVAAQRRLGDHDTRLRVDIAGYRDRRREALERFARSVAEQVVASGTARSLEPMPSADRKVIHDVLATVDGVASHSVGEEPSRRVVITPA